MRRSGNLFGDCATRLLKVEMTPYTATGKPVLHQSCISYSKEPSSPRYGLKAKVKMDPQNRSNALEQAKNSQCDVYDILSFHTTTNKSPNIFLRKRVLKTALTVCFPIFLPLEVTENSCQQPKIMSNWRFERCKTAGSKTTDLSLPPHFSRFF